MADAAFGMSGHHLAFEEVEQADEWPASAVAWYVCMTLLVLINLALFFVVHYVLLSSRRDGSGGWTRSDSEASEKPYNARMHHAGLTVLIVFAYRTFFLVSAMDRFVWHDSFFSCILLIKILTYLGEQAFAGMIIYAMTEIVNSLENGAMKIFTKIGTIVFYAAVVAGQIFSFVALCKKSWYYMIIRTWCWFVGFLVITPVPFYIVFAACKASRDKGDGLCGNCRGPDGLNRSAELFGLIMSIFLVWYLPWCCFQELPLNYARWDEEYENNPEDLNFLRGLWDALTFRVQTKDWELWKTVVWWNTACNTFGGWVAIFFSTAPQLPVRQGRLFG